MQEKPENEIDQLRRKFTLEVLQLLGKLRELEERIVILERKQHESTPR